MGSSLSEQTWRNPEICDKEWNDPPERTGGQVQILVVDDDPSFGKILNRIGQQSQVLVTVCQTLEQLRGLPEKKFHAAIVDYDLGNFDGIEVARRLEVSDARVPVILVSQSQLVETPISCWPSNVKGFLHKALGHFAILEAALAAHDATTALGANYLSTAEKEKADL
jgi:DNA-binding response OmpR family regulator